MTTYKQINEYYEWQGSFQMILAIAIGVFIWLNILVFQILGYINWLN